jgi:hypothetical protein
MRSRGVIAAIMIAALWTPIGCGGGGAAGEGSCTLSEGVSDTGVALQICEEATGLSAAQLDQLRQTCTPSGGGPSDAGVDVRAQFSNGPCPRAGALGGCRVVQGTITETIWYYAGVGAASDIQTLCAAAGAAYVAP